MKGGLSPITKRQRIPSSQKGALGNILEHHKLLLMAELLDLLS